MRRLLLLPCLALGLNAQAPIVSVIRQPRATLGEFTMPFTEFDVQDHGDVVRFHVGAGIGVRRWNGGDTAVRVIGDANAFINDLFVGAAVVGEFPSGESAFIGPRLRVGWAFHPRMALSLEGEHLERPFGDGLAPRRRSSLGLAFTVRF
ncbi:MAG TPA: hypothetical protein VJ570_09395 [Holophagaceae bacterium]|nr:hypothetical protein [Holophagaceae bacterium]